MVTTRDTPINAIRLDTIEDSPNNAIRRQQTVTINVDIREENGVDVAANCDNEKQAITTKITCVRKLHNLLNMIKNCKTHDIKMKCIYVH